MTNYNRKPLFSDTVIRIVLWDIAIFFLLFVTSNVFTVVITNKILTDNLDDRLKNKIETLAGYFKIQNDSVVFNGYSEINEPDFTTVNSGAIFLQVKDTKDKLLLYSGNLVKFGKIPFDVSSRISENEFYNMTAGKHQLRVVYTPLFNEQKKVMANVQLAIFRTEYSSIMKKIVIFNLCNLPFILLVIILVSIFLAKKSYSPLNKVINIAENISANNLKARIEIAAHPQDELGRLRDTLNNLFTRLEVQINQISQFTDNASHQLMTPLTAVKTELEYILKKNRGPEEYKETLLMLNTQTDKMINIIKSLLILAKYSSSMELQKNVFSISKFIDDLIKPHFKDHLIDYEITNDLFLRGSNEGFQLIMENLIDNAIKYSPADSKIVIKANKLDGSVIISVEDCGIGIADKEKEKIFERFYRSESALKKNIFGIGLGLCLVKAIVLSMDGKIKVEDNIPAGTRVIISFPIVNVV